MAESPALWAVLVAHLVDVDAERVPVRLQGRDEAYWIITARRARKYPTPR